MIRSNGYNDIYRSIHVFIVCYLKKKFNTYVISHWIILLDQKPAIATVD